MLEPVKSASRVSGVALALLWASAFICAALWPLSVQARNSDIVPESKPLRAVSGVFSPEDASAADRAFDALERRQWSTALQIAAQANDPLVARIIQHRYLASPRSAPDFAELSNFVLAYPNWPNMSQLIGKAEKSIGPELPLNTRLDWFKHHPPTTPEGRYQAATAFLEAGDHVTGPQIIRATWREGGFARNLELDILRRHGNLLTDEDHLARFDGLVWRGQRAAVRRMLPLVDQHSALLARARLSLRYSSPGVDAAIARLPESLHTDPGLVYERVRWRARHGRSEAALELAVGNLRPLPQNADEQTKRRWWRQRSVLARRALADHAYETAYALAGTHRFMPDSDARLYAEAESLAGWIALRFLAKPTQAMQHFTAMYEAVSYPISRARAAYWAGRSASSNMDAKIASEWFQRATRYPETFYGQLAADHIRINMTHGVTRAQPIDENALKNFSYRDLPRVARLYAERQEDRSLRQFFAAVARTPETPQEHQLVAALGRTVLGRPDLALWAAKRSARKGIWLFEDAYPLVELPAELSEQENIEPALILAVSRQESGFDPGAVSSAGARGLMQLMPATAKRIARKLKVSYRPQWLLTDPAYNALLGVTLLEDLVRQYDGSYILALAAYNAGEYRVDQWRKRYGDPLRPGADVVDWIEMIPFAETRNYVQRVMEAVAMYRIRLGTTNAPFTLEADLKRGKAPIQEISIPIPRPTTAS